MRFPRFMNTFTHAAVLGLLSFVSTIHAAVPEDAANFISLGKTVQFEDFQGEETLVEPGNYMVTKEENALQLTNTLSKTSTTLEADETSHTSEISTPTAVSVPGQEGPLANTHIIMLFLPNGQVWQAVGTYPGIQSRAIPQDMPLSGSPNTVTFDKAVYFTAPDGSPVIVEAGDYTAEDAQDWIRLIPGSERHDALLIEAQKGTNDAELDELIALSLPGSTEQESDRHYLMLMLPNGQTLEATGSYSGIQPRGWLDKTFQKAKKQVNKTYKQAHSTVRKTGKNLGRTAQKVGKDVNQAALQAKRAAEKAAKDAAEKAKYLAQQTAIGACKVALKTTQAVAKAKAMILDPLKKQLAKALQLPKAQKALLDAIETIKLQQAASIQRVIEAAQILSNPKNTRAVKQLMDPDRMCDKPAQTVQNTFKNMIGGPIRQALAVVNSGNGSQVRSRGSFASATLALGGNAAKVGGGEIGVRFAFDFVNQSHWFLDLAGMVKTNVGGGGGVQLGIFPRKDPVQTGGWFLGAGVSFPLPKVPQNTGGGLDFYFDFPLEIQKPFKLKWNLTSAKFFLDHFQGFGVSFGGGKNALPADIALKIGGGIRLSKK
ncbi:MAG: hypothetical protein KC594_16450 [Nitrospira sp.]|nr:hypothetical protein [Nitrospira sp.]